MRYLRRTQPLPTTADQPVETDVATLFSGVLWQVRWVVLAGLLLLSFAQPLVGRAGLPTWALILGFVLYNLVLELLRRRITLLPLIDLPVVAALYAASGAPGGPPYVLVLLVVACAAVTLSLRASLAYTGVAAALMAVIAPTLPFWLASTWQIRELGAQLIVVLLVGAGTALLTRQIVRSQAQAQASRDEAARLAELNALRTRFFASISHELRTPLTAVKAALGLLDASLDTRLQPDERRLIANARRNVARLDGVIGDLLALNQIEAGVLPLDPEPLDLREVVAAALPAVQPLIAQKDQQLTVELPTPLPVDGDQRRLEQVVVNLLGNAHEHTPAGTVIRITGQTTLERATLIVADSGPGIEVAAHDHLFKSFWQLDRSTGGSGLGLAIVKGVVDLHGGQIRLVSEPGAGTTVRVSFPRSNGVYEPIPPIARAQQVAASDS